MGRSPCCEESGVKKGPWTQEEDEKLIDYINKNGNGSWRTLAKRAGLNRCGKSCRLRWTNYLRPDIKRGKFTQDEETLIINLHSLLGNKWSKIATHLPGRTDNEIKNFWNTQIRKKLLQMGIDPETHKPRTDFNHLMNLSQLLIGMPNFSNNATMMNTNWGNTNNPMIGLQGGDVTQLAKLQLLQNLLQIMNSNNNSFLNIGNNNNNNSNNPYLIGNPSLNMFNTNAYFNGSNNTLQSMEPNLVLKNEEYANSGGGIFSQLVQRDPSHHHNGLSGSKPQQEDLDYTKISSILHENNQETNPLPALVATFPTGTTSSFHNSNTTAQTSTHESPNNSNTVFDDWEKFLENETSGSYWKEILDLTSTSASPNSW